MKSLTKSCAAALALALVACTDIPSPTSLVSAPIAPHADFVIAGLGSTYDFEGDFAASASPFLPIRTAVIPSDTYATGGKAFLGKFRSDHVTMTTEYVGNGYLNLSLYIVGTWDGVKKNKYGNDTWEVSAYCGNAAVGNPAGTFTTSFSNKTNTHQSYPDALGGPTHEGLTGATDVGSLGFGTANEVRSTNFAVSAYSAVYTMSWKYPAPCAAPGQVTWLFTSPSEMLQESYDEFWGIDNVSVTASANYTPRTF